MLQVQTFEQLLRAAAAKFADQPFLIEDQLLGTVSYSELLAFANGLRIEFDRLGIPQGAAVATLFHNCGLAALLFLATIASRRVLVPLNPLSTSYELDYILEQAQCVAVLTDPAHTRSADYRGRQTITIHDHRHHCSSRVSEGTNTASGTDERYENGAGAPFVGEIVFTSGSTGRPKGVVLSERSLLSDALALASVYDLRSSDRFLTVCPLFHNSGQVLTTLACALVGGSTAAIKSDIGMLHFWSYVEKYRAQWSLGMTSFLALLLAGSEEPPQPVPLRGLLTGGSAIDGSLIKRFESRFKVPVRTVYGLTETASISTCEYLDPSPRSFGSSGRPLPICTVRIDSGNPASLIEPVPDEQGEILISGENLFECYVGEPELTRSRKDGEWLRTGDVGYFDATGNLFVLDRMDSMLIVGGENVYPAEVEKLRTYLPGATDIVLTGVDHTIWGTQLVLVYKKEGAETVSIASWHRILTAQLTAAKIPQRYVSVQDLGLSDFPRKDNGKLDRQAVKVLLRERLPSLANASR